MYVWHTTDVSLTLFLQEVAQATFAPGEFPSIKMNGDPVDPQIFSSTITHFETDKCLCTSRLSTK